MKKWKWIHKWFSLVLGVFVILWAVSGIILNHRNLVSGINVNRNCLPEVYHYKNWNNAAVRGALQLRGDSLLLYGNVGVWLTDTAFSDYKAYWDGFPKGVDNRKINKLFRSKSGQVYAATQSGLYQLDQNSAR
ncbi:MAG TPA: PepSY domain-containing protein, partial [Bacteroidales bacterium]|nr:PepSY domain-containing protein [Bacteroidales bacterium]